MKLVSTLGIDLAKSTISLHSVNSNGEVMQPGMFIDVAPAQRMMRLIRFEVKASNRGVSWTRLT